MADLILPRKTLSRTFSGNNGKDKHKAGGKHYVNVELPGPTSPPLERDWQEAEEEMERILMAFPESLDPTIPDAGMSSYADYYILCVLIQYNWIT